jgi:hypothetical protein
VLLQAQQPARLSRASALSSTIRIRGRGAARARRRLGGAAPDATGRSIAGRLTVKVAPWPRPALAARIVPSFISTSRRARVRPMPRPPRSRARLRSPWTNRSNTRPISSGGMPSPVSRTSTTAAPPSGRTETSIRPRGRRVLQGVVEQVRHDLLDPGAVRVHPDLVQVAPDLVMLEAIAAAPGPDHRRDHRSQVERLALQTDLAAGDPPDLRADRPPGASSA